MMAQKQANKKSLINKRDLQNPLKQAELVAGTAKKRK